MALSQDFFAYLCQKYPKLQGEALESNIAPQLLSPYFVQIPSHLRDQIEKTIRAFQSLRSEPTYLSWAQKKFGPLFVPGNNSLFMSYDFHITADEKLKLIEINTNASFLALGWEMFQFFQTPWNADFKLEDIKTCFETEMELAGSTKKLNRVVITDEEPSNQRLYIEFLLYKQIFQQMGLECEIADIQNQKVLQSADLIYNRSTDFYFEDPKSVYLKELYQSRKSVLTPQPLEYRLLADKENFIFWSEPEFWENVQLHDTHKSQILSVLPQTRVMTTSLKDQIWSERKHLFFKPKRAFGSKSAYKGASMSRKVFEDLMANESLAQELIPAPEVEIETPQGLQKFKYDLRCYAYRDQFQGCVARLYQGQVTNLRTEGGGFAPVRVS